MGRMASISGIRKFFFFVFLLIFLFPFSTSRADEMKSTVIIHDSRIDVSIETGAAPLSQPEVMKWVESAAESVVAYYGHFPIPRLTLRVISFDGSGVRHGVTWGRDGGLIRINAGGRTSEAEFAEDWMLTHEMIHLAFPSMMGDEHHWIEEGLSVYVEPIARIRAGNWTARQMWSDLVRDMPKGLPREGDEGLDHTHTWGRTYWGGALFCLMADVEIRRRTRNRKGLEDALRGILESGGDIRDDWELQKALKVGDQSAGVDVLEKLYADWKDKPVTVDLPAMWKQLGVEPEGAGVRLNDSAPLAAVRKAIEMGTPGTKAGEGAAPTKSGGVATKPFAVFAGRTVGSN